MATLASNVTWGSGPVIYFDFSYTKKREGSTQYYKITVNCDPCTGTHYFGYPIYLSIKLDGSTVATKTLKNASPSQWSSSLSYTTGWLAVKNKTTGTTSLAIRVYSGLGSSRNKTYSYSLPIDPAASKIGATDADIESTSTISITRYAADFTTTVSYKAAGQSSYTTIWTKEAYSSYGWTVPNSLYDLIPNKKEIKVTIRCQTYSGDTLIGTETTTMTATTNQSKCAPVVSVYAGDVNEESVLVTGDYNTLISGISNLRVATTATAKNSATITTIVAYCGGRKLSGSDVIFTGADSASVYVIVTDSREYAIKVDVPTISLIGYLAPTIVPTITRDTPTGNTVTVSVKGRWYSGSLGSITNTLRIRVRYKVSDESSYGSYVEVPVTQTGNEYAATVNLSGIAYNKAYSFQIRLDDEIYTDANGYRDAKYTIVALSKGIPIFDWGEDDFAFHVPVRIEGTLTIGETTITEKQLAELIAFLEI